MCPPCIRLWSSDLPHKSRGRRKKSSFRSFLIIFFVESKRFNYKLNGFETLHHSETENILLCAMCWYFSCHFHFPSVMVRTRGKIGFSITYHFHYDFICNLFDGREQRVLALRGGVVRWRWLHIHEGATMWRR